jgi:hypothetical protein
VAGLQAELNAIEVELGEAAAFLEANGFSPTIGQRVKVLEARKAELDTKLLDARAKAACPAGQALREYGSLLDALAKAPDPRDARVRLGAALRRLVDFISFLVLRRGAGKLAAVQVYFRGGARREYLIDYRAPNGNSKVKGAGQWRVRSLDTPNFHPETPAKFGLVIGDLSDPTEAQTEAEVLGQLTPEQLETAFSGCPWHPLP